MNRSSLTMAIALLPAAILALFRCGTLNEPSLAGGSGAGNPGGTVSLAMVAKTDPALWNARSSDHSDISIVDSSKPIEITDKVGLRFTISEVDLRSIDIRFMLDTGVKPGKILSSMYEKPPYLSFDSNSIIFSGPPPFNAVGGSSAGSMEPLRLPVGRYTGVKLLFARDCCWQHLPDSQSSRIVMNGSFFYSGATHKLTINIHRSMQPYYRFAGGIFTLSPKDTTHLELQFNARHWFAKVDFGYGLQRKWIEFDSTNSLVVSSDSKNFFIQQIEGSISQEFLASGRLVVY